MTVFIVQKQMRFDSVAGELVPRFKTISKAAQHGKIEYLLSPTANPFNTEKIVEELHTKLKKFRDGDFLLLIGNPVLIGLATTIAANYNKGSVDFLQWSGKDNDYVEISTRIF